MSIIRYQYAAYIGVRMYQTLVHKGFETVGMIVGLREWLRPLWPMFSLTWAVAMAALLYLYVSPNTPPPTEMIEGVDIGLDKVFHIIAHAGLLALPLAIVPNRRLAWFMASLAIAAGIGFEFAQLFVPERNFDLADLTANFAGLVIGARTGRLIHEL